MLHAIASLEHKQGGLGVDEATVFARGEVIRGSIFYSGESAYSFQYRNFALERYSKDNPWLRANKGFGIEEAHAIACALANLTSRKLATLEGKAF
jgi:hypothetical protein